ncbi:sulfate permease [Purpureocillium lavendulum]|uniref:Sulfate permease n=1 Tax=Purpureocillium lavendulum TaxID=1247861 RepID=A0AB34G687_9HYPO|nr:sulfate permease [Purpureocillium lavendulum]
MSEHGPAAFHHRHDKLRIFSSPLVRRDTGGSDDSEDSSRRRIDDNRSEWKGRRGYEQDDDLPQFRRYEEPTLLEIFFDLFFAANYNVFSDTQQVTNHAKFKAYVGYFCLLWLTWFLVTLFDVRFVTDSIFARVTRAIQLGVLVGFAVVAPKFNPSDQHRDTMRAMSLILMVSRLCLAVEYASTLWHVRKYKKARLPFYLQIALHVAAAAVYLGISFRFRVGERSRVYMTWYFISGAEAIGSILLSNLSPVVSLTKTHLMKRMTLLTVMIMGDGIVQVAKEVVTIVKNPDAWDSTTIGLVSAAAATIYFVFLVYFDWLKSSFYLPPIRQQLWTSIHLPFHLSLVLFMQGFTQYLIWSKIVNQINRLNDIADPHDDARLATSIAVRDSINASVQAFFRDYPPRISTTMDTVNDALNNITQIPDSVWPLIENSSSTFDTVDGAPQDVQDALVTLFTVGVTLATSMANALFAAFGIKVDEDIAEKDPGAAKNFKGGEYQFLVQEKTESRYALVFAYGYIASGCTMLFMAVLTMIVKKTPYTAWPIIRLVLVFLLAIGTGLVATMWFNQDLLLEFLWSTWVLPTITFVWSAVLVLTHLNGQAIKRNKHRFTRKNRDDKSSYDPVSVPMTSPAEWTSARDKFTSGPDEGDAEAQRRAPFTHSSSAASDHEPHARQRSEEGIGLAYGGSERPHSSYDPLKASTEYRGASAA